MDDDEYEIRLPESWNEAGRPAWRPSFAVMAPIVRQFYSLPGNGVGGLLHIVLDDGNIEDHHIGWCGEQAVKAGDELAYAIAVLLMRCSKRTRERLAEMDK